MYVKVSNILFYFNYICTVDEDSTQAKTPTSLALYLV